MEETQPRTEMEKQSEKREETLRFRYADFVSMSTEQKQDAVEKLFSSTRRKMHPLIRMDDLLDGRYTCFFSIL